MKRLILASESPRRKDLLKKAGLEFQVFPVKVSEIPNETLNVQEQILDIASRKARAAAERIFHERPELQPFVLLAADTEVIWEGKTLGKPATREEAVAVLTRLSGHVHEVVTAVQIFDNSDGKLISHLETTLVHFRELTATEISDYVATGEPMDKAGSYGIQGLGGGLVQKIEGDFDNVVGLPVTALLSIFNKKNWNFSK